jgi:membrane associated rhomboid family serine protease
MIPLSDGMAPRRFPVVTVALIAANVVVWLFYELPNLNASIEHASFYPCTVDGSCDGPEPVWISWVTSMFLHGSWDHILGNMLFLAVFGKNVEDRLGRLPYLLFYFAGGLAATVTQTAMTLLAGTAADAQTPNLGASGAIAAVLGAYFILFPGAQIRGLIGFWPVTLSAWFFLGFWFLYQLFEANFGIFESSAHGGGVAFFAHVGGFVFGALVAKGLVASGRLQDDPAPRRVWT